MGALTPPSLHPEAPLPGCHLSPAIQPSSDRRLPRKEWSHQSISHLPHTKLLYIPRYTPLYKDAHFDNLLSTFKFHKHLGTQAPHIGPRSPSSQLGLFFQQRSNLSVGGSPRAQHPRGLLATRVRVFRLSRLSPNGLLNSQPPQSPGETCSVHSRHSSQLCRHHLAPTVGPSQSLSKFFSLDNLPNPLQITLSIFSSQNEYA